MLPPSFASAYSRVSTQNEPGGWAVTENECPYWVLKLEVNVYCVAPLGTANTSDHETPS